MPGQDEIKPHPLLEKLEAAGDTNPLTLLGYIGPSPTPGNVRVYARLDDLTEFAEIPRDSIHHVEPAPESELPFGGSVIWVKSDTDVSSTAIVRPDKGEYEVRRGRLQIMVRHGQRLSDVCTSRCQVCTSRCQVCQSRCSAGFDPGGRFTAGGIGRFAGAGNLASEVCTSRCQVCTSRCQVCQSRCSAGFNVGNRFNAGRFAGGIGRFVGNAGNFASEVCTSRCQVCTSRCQVCTSRCQVCQSRCSAGFNVGNRFVAGNRFNAGGFARGGAGRFGPGAFGGPGGPG